MRFLIRHILTTTILLICLTHTCLPVYSQSNKAKDDSLKKEIGQFGFIENKGQLHDQYGRANNAVKYFLPLNGMNVHLKSNGFSYDTYIPTTGAGTSTSTRADRGQSKLPDPVTYAFHRVDITLAGANPSCKIITAVPSHEYIMYYNEANPAGMKVHHFTQITYQEIYPGIDLLFDTRIINNKQQFEYYFIVRPNGNINDIQLKYAGADNKIEGATIKMDLAHGELSERIPESYLLKDGAALSFPHTQDKKVIVQYKVSAKNIYGFRTSAYDKSKTLVIDPTPDLVWGTYYGSTLNDWGYAITRDNSGNIVVSGSSDNNSNIATAGAYQTTYGGNTDAIVCKFQPDGTRLWVSYYGGSQSDQSFTVSTDAIDNIIIGGHTDSDNGIATPGCHQPTKAVGRDGFIAKFTSAGNRIWGTYFGGEEVEQLHSVRIDPSNYIIVAGWTHSTTGISTPGSHQSVYGGGTLGDAGDGFVAKFNPNGVIQWGTYFGRTSFDRFYDIDLDNLGNIYATGITFSTSGIATPGAYQIVYGGGTSDALLVKFTTNGVLAWATYFGGLAQDLALCVAVDQQNNVIIAGETLSTTGITTNGTHQPAYGGGIRDGFVAKYNSTGLRIWSTYFGGNGEEEILGITTDLNDNIFLTGWTYSTAGISTTNAYQTTGGGLAGIWTTFVVKLNSNSIRQWGTYYGTSGPFGQGIGEDLVTDPAGNVFVTGWTSFTNNISICGAVQPAWGGNLDMFVCEFSETVTAASSITITANPGGPVCAGAPVTFTATANNAGTNPTYQWKINGNNVGTNNPVYTTTTLNIGDIITCELTSSITPCNPAGIVVMSNSIQAQIDFIVTPAITISASATSICTGATVNFTATGTNGGTSPVYQWTVNGSPVGTNSPTYNSSVLSNGDIVSCTLTSSAGCTTSPTAVSNPISITVNSIPAPALTITISGNNICKGDPVTFTATPNNAPPTPSFQWQVNGSNSGTNSTTYNSSSLADGDQVTCLLSGTVPGCPIPVSAVSNSITLLVRNTPTLDLTAAFTTIFFGDNTQLTGIAGGNITSFTWTPTSGLSNSAILNPTAGPTETTKYVLRVNDVNGCYTEKDITINVIREIFIPSAFTPNKDGKNDVFRIPPGISFDLQYFSVYDRWGNEIFRTSDLQKGWDGTYRGIESPIGVYIYVIKGRSYKGDVFLRGHVSLIR